MHTACTKDVQPVREAVSYRGLFTAGWFGVREKHCSQLEIYDRLRASEQADGSSISTLHTNRAKIQTFQFQALPQSFPLRFEL